MNRTALLLALAAAATIAAPAHAAGADNGSVAVRYTDLDLATEQGQKALDERLDSAARKVCGMDERATGTRIASREATRCYREARAQLAERFADVVSNARRGG